MEESNTKLESTVFQSILPTTLVNMNRLVVKQTPLFPAYRQRQAHYIAHVNSKLNEELSLYLSEQKLTGSCRNGNVFHRTESIAPSVQTLLDETRKVPARMREAYIQQWRHLLVRKALALIKWVEKEA
ncbi:hypothetical protein BDF14DRAFT_1720777 [Spinellus fusiger]|nr:hypothetical protein BDF14DRAFT_1720777 [Spinellus fusiger]